MKRTCPICNRTYDGHPAISRKDDCTRICPNCGLREALEAYANVFKVVYTENTFDVENAKIGDLVTQGVVENFMNCMPPASMRYDCAQLGEPYIHERDPETKKYRATFLTFKCVGNKTWEYCGHCFRGENKERRS